MATRITEDQKIQMNILYKELKTYAAVARVMGVAASTVKRYIIPDFVNPEEIEIKTVQIKELPPVDINKFKQPFGNLCLLSEEEKEEVKELWKELLV